MEKFKINKKMNFKGNLKAENGHFGRSSKNSNNNIGELDVR